MNEVSVFFISEANPKSKTRSLDSVEISQSTMEYLMKKKLFGLLSDKKERKTLRITIDDEIAECKYESIVSLDQNRDLLTSYLDRILVEIKDEIHPGMSNTEREDLDRRLYDVYKLYFKVKDELNHEYLTFFEGEETK